MLVSEPKKSVYLLFILQLFFLSPPSAMAMEDDPDALWKSNLKIHFFGDREIQTENPLIELKAPKRAANPALVPITITSKISQEPEHYVKTIYLIIDKNPKPLAGKFSFTQESGQADLSMRIRINEYSKVRVIAELNDGSLSMATRFVKASGGCAAPVGSDIDKAMARLGKIKLFPRGERLLGKPLFTQFMVSHPNITGLQMDQLTRMYAPQHYIIKIEVSFNGKLVMHAETDISISENPSIGFYFVPSKPGELKVKVEDSKGLTFSKVRKIFGEN
jgi:sulfur-oxidizing protein SoxY